MDRHKKPQERSRYTFPVANTLAITINRNKKRTLSYKTVQRNGYEKAVGVRLGYSPLEKTKKPLKIKGFHGGRNRTRTCDPIDVNDVLYQLSHATMSISFSDDAINYTTAFVSCQRLFAAFRKFLCRFFPAGTATHFPHDKHPGLCYTVAANVGHKAGEGRSCCP